MGNKSVIVVYGLKFTTVLSTISNLPSPKNVFLISIGSSTSASSNLKNIAVIDLV